MPRAGPLTVEFEKRRFHRYDVRCSVEMTAGAWHEAFDTVDLGGGGCRIAVHRPPEQGASVTIRLRSARSRREPRGQARVAWVSDAEPFQAGLAFSEDLTQRMTSFMQDLLGPVPIRADES
jgi:hypothetical protein